VHFISAYTLLDAAGDELLVTSTFNLYRISEYVCILFRHAYCCAEDAVTKAYAVVG